MVYLYLSTHIFLKKLCYVGCFFGEIFCTSILYAEILLNFLIQKNVFVDYFGDTVYTIIGGANKFCFFLSNPFFPLGFFFSLSLSLMEELSTFDS